MTYERAYYHCPHCRTGWHPSDEELRVEQRRSPGLKEVLTLVGTLESFEEGGQGLMARLTGVPVSAATIRRVTETVGEDLAARRRRGEAIGPDVCWKWHRDTAGRRTAYVSLDAVAVLQQGPRASKAEARMAWIGAVFNPPPRDAVRRRVGDRRYVSGLMSLSEIGRQLRRECQGVGVERADVVVAVTDGGNGLEDCLVEALGGLSKETHFVLDFFHASEHLLAFAKALSPHDESLRRERHESWRRTLKEKGGEALLSVLEKVDLRGRPRTVKEEHRKLLGYVKGNRHRMDYPEYVRRGWLIGSGMIEAACKTVVGHRMKASGMRWKPAGTEALCQLRALRKSEPRLWACYWLNSA